MAWQYPEGGKFSIAVPGDEDIVKTVETFFGRELARYNHSIFWEHRPYIVFFFATASDAERCIARFHGECFDPRDKGRGPHWSQWYKGKTAKLLSRRRPYDFS